MCWRKNVESIQVIFPLVFRRGQTPRETCNQFSQSKHSNLVFQHFPQTGFNYLPGLSGVIKIWIQCRGYIFVPEKFVWNNTWKTWLIEIEATVLAFTSGANMSASTRSIISLWKWARRKRKNKHQRIGINCFSALVFVLMLASGPYSQDTSSCVCANACVGFVFTWHKFLCLC